MTKTAPIRLTLLIISLLGSNVLASGHANAQGGDFSALAAWPAEGIARPGEFIVRLKEGASVAASGETIVSLLAEGGAGEAPSAAASPSAVLAVSGSGALAIEALTHDTLKLAFPVDVSGSSGGELAGASSAFGFLTPGTVQELIADQLGVSAEDIVVVPNYIGYLAAQPNDTRFALQWHHKAIGSPEAWDLRSSAAKVTVAVLDSGVMLDHEDIAGNLWTNPNPHPNPDPGGCTESSWGRHGYDFLNCDADPSAEFLPWQSFDPESKSCVITGGGLLKKWETHGTQVAGVIGAVGNNAKGVAGVAWDTKLMMVKVGNGVCGTVDLSAILTGIDFAVKNGADIINASWAGFPDKAVLLESAIRRAGEAGVIFVAASGNNGRDLDITPDYPASFNLENMITVASIGRNERLSEFSNKSSTSVHIAAPGEAVYSTTPRPYATKSESSYAANTGTSFAAPLVTGTVALILQGFEKHERAAALSQVRASVLSSAGELHTDDRALIAGGKLDIGRVIKPSSAALVGQNATFAALESHVSESLMADLSAWSSLDHESVKARLRAELTTQLFDFDKVEIEQLAVDLADQIAGNSEDVTGSTAPPESSNDAIIVLKKGFTIDQYSNLLSKEGVDLGRLVSPADNAFAVGVKSGLDKDEILKNLIEQPYILDMSPNFQGSFQ